MKILVQFLPNKLYQWALLFYASVPFFVVLMFMVLPILNALIEPVGLKVKTQVLLVTVLFLYAIVFVWQIFFRLFSVFKKKTPIAWKRCLLNTGLFVITIPIVAGYLLFGISVTWMHVEPFMTNMWLVAYTTGPHINNWIIFPHCTVLDTA
jgi:hypothetical protein